MKEKECIWVKYLIYVVLSQFQLYFHFADFLRQICIPQISEFTKKGFFQVWLKPPKLCNSDLALIVAMSHQGLGRQSTAAVIREATERQQESKQ